MQMNPEINLADEIAALERKLAEKKASLGPEGTEKHDKQVLHEVVGEHFLETGKERPTTSTVTTDSDDDDDDVDAQNVANQPAGFKEVSKPSYEEPEMRQKVQDLITFAFSDGIGKAVSKVKATSDAALIDAFHDVLVDELYEHLVREGRIPKLE